MFEKLDQAIAGDWTAPPAAIGSQALPPGGGGDVLPPSSSSRVSPGAGLALVGLLGLLLGALAARKASR